MGILVLASLLATSFLGVSGAAPDASEVAHDMNVSIGISSPDSDYLVHIFAPKSSESFPTIFFVSGFGANAPVFGYSDLLSLIANKGYVVVALNGLTIPNYPVEARKFVDVLTWAEQGNLKAEMISRKFTAIPDLSRTTVMAQSSGNHIVGQALAYNCMYAKAFVMIDPVDGVDPFGIVTSEDFITPGKKVNFSIPVLLLDNGLDPKGTKAFPTVPCAPLNLGTPRWYNAWRGPIWRVNATAYGHVDCLNDVLIGVAGLMCPTNPTTDKAIYREHLATSSDLFIQALLGDKPENLLLLENSSHFSVDVLLEHDRKGLKNIEAGCTPVPDRSLETLV